MKRTTLIIFTLFALHAGRVSGQVQILPIHTDSASYTPDYIHVWAHIQVSPLGKLTYLGYATQDSAHRNLTNLWVASELKSNVVSAGPAGIDSFVADAYIPVHKTGNWWCWIGGWDMLKYNLDSSNMVRVYADTIKGDYSGIMEGGSVVKRTGMDFYPSPAHDHFTVINHDGAEQVLNIYNLQGRLIRTEMIKGMSQMNISEIPTGVYLLEMKNTRAKIFIE